MVFYVATKDLASESNWVLDFISMLLYNNGMIKGLTLGNLEDIRNKSNAIVREMVDEHTERGYKVFLAKSLHIHPSVLSRMLSNERLKLPRRALIEALREK